MHIGAAMFFTDYSMTPAELATALEERGFESVWAPEHSHIPLTRKSALPGGGELPKKYYDAMDPFVTLTAAAAVTKKLKVGTGVCLVNQRDPIQTAKPVASIDQVSAAASCSASATAGTRTRWRTTAPTSRRRHKLVRERIEAMKAIWTKSKAEYHGDMVKFDPMMAWPKPAQKPHPPILVGGAFPYGARRAVRYGDGWMPLRRRKLRRGARPDPEVPGDGQGSQPRPRLAAGLDLGTEGGRGRAQARPGRGRRARHRQPRLGEVRQDPAPARPLGEARGEGGLVIRGPRASSRSARPRSAHDHEAAAGRLDARPRFAKPAPARRA